VNLIWISWRNLWRNRRRTAITMAAVALNTLILITTFSLTDGILDHTVKNATQLMTGEAQLHAPGYLSDRSLYKTVTGPGDILAALRERSIGAVQRVYGNGLVSRGTKSAGALFWGVEPEMEKQTLELAGHVAEGAFLDPYSRKTLVLGKKLAKSLDARVGSEIVVLVQAADGSMGNELFTVAGILKSVGGGVDRSAAIMRLEDFRELFVMSEGIHEIAANTKGLIPLPELPQILSRLAPQDEVRTWRQLMPTISDMIELSAASSAVFGAIFVLAAGLGVMNTMLMATFERAHEFGLIKALGASPWIIVRDIAVEAWLLACISTLFGALFGIALSYVLETIGLDTSSLAGEITIGDVAFDPVWRAALSLKAVLKPVVTMWMVCVLAALYPAALSARLDPVKSMQKV
jgi:ABC-type lipoprotein release transport system permease subunit